MSFLVVWGVGLSRGERTDSLLKERERERLCQERWSTLDNIIIIITKTRDFDEEEEDDFEEVIVVFFGTRDEYDSSNDDDYGVVGGEFRRRKRKTSFFFFATSSFLLPKEARRLGRAPPSTSSSSSSSSSWTMTGRKVVVALVVGTGVAIATVARGGGGGSGAKFAKSAFSDDKGGIERIWAISRIITPCLGQSPNITTQETIDAEKKRTPMPRRSWTSSHSSKKESTKDVQQQAGEETNESLAELGNVEKPSPAVVEHRATKLLRKKQSEETPLDAKRQGEAEEKTATTIAMARAEENSVNDRNIGISPGEGSEVSPLRNRPIIK